MKRFLRRAPVWLAWTLAVVVVLLILFYAEEDWRGARDWAACQKELQAKGEILDLRQLVPPGKPEDDLRKVPLFTKNYLRNPTRYVGLIMKISPPPQLKRLDIYFGNDDSYKYKWPDPANYLARESIDLAAWQKFYRSLPDAHLPQQVGTPAQDVLQALSQFDSQLNEIETAVDNPKAYWSINYDKPFLSPLEGPNSMQQLAAVLLLRGVAHLDNQDSESAGKDFLFLLKLSEPLTKGCFFSNFLVIRGVHGCANHLLWEGLHRHAWNQPQLNRMEAALATTDFLVLTKDSFRVERAAMLRVMDVLQTPDADFLKTQEIHPDYSVSTVLRLSPIRAKGWWDQDRRRDSLEMQKRIEAIHSDRGILDANMFAYHPFTFETKQWLRICYTPISIISLRVTEGVGSMVAKAETYRRLARLACRLEEYRIAQGHYPEKLEELPDLPAHLNQEVLSEQPLRYQRKGEGYLLYSVGWNEKDDGGVIAQDSKEGDWVWPSP